MRSSPESSIPLSAEGAGQLLHISRQAVDKRRRSGALLAIRQGGDWLYPRTQFHEHEALPRLADVIKGLALLEFLVTEDTVLDATSLPRVEMPNRNGLTSPDPRPDVP